TVTEFRTLKAFAAVRPASAAVELETSNLCPARCRPRYDRAQRSGVQHVGQVRPRGKDAGMTRLSKVDLSVKLPKKQGLDRLEAAQQRLLRLRLLLGGQLTDHKLGP